VVEEEVGEESIGSQKKNEEKGQNKQKICERRR
jgi:hypothetical protein